MSTDEFEAHRDHLRAVALRMLGSRAEAEDALQEAWLRLFSSGTDNVANQRAFLTTVVARICLDMLRSRKARREVWLDASQTAAGVSDSEHDPEHEAELADSVGLAMLVILDTLTPSERLAFVLHDMFAMPFAEIAPVLGRSVPATKMLASRARRRVRAAESAHPGRQLDPGRQRALVGAFLAASRKGDFDALLEILDPEVTVTAETLRGTMTVSGARAVAEQELAFSHMASHARITEVGGAPAIVVAPAGRVVTVMTFELANDRIKRIGIRLNSA